MPSNKSSSCNLFKNKFRISEHNCNDKNDENIMRFNFTKLFYKYVRK
jgi:hypothetical protein